MGIFSLAVSTDARWLAVGEENNGHLTVWDIPSQKEILRLPEGEHPDVFYLRAAFSPTEPLLAYGSSSGFPPTNFVSRVRIWNLKTHRQVAEFPLEFLCTGLAFSRDGAQLVTSTLNYLTVWDVRTGTKLKTYPFGSQHSIGTPVSITPDFRLVAQSYSIGRIRVFDLAQGRELWNTNAAPALIEAVALSGDGRWLATADASDQSVIRIWDALDGKAIASFAPAPGGVVQLLFGPDHRTLISAHTDQTIRVWDCSNQVSIPPPRILIGHPLEVWRLALAPDGKTLISGGKDGSVRFWDLTRPPRQRGAVTLWVGVLPRTKRICWPAMTRGSSLAGAGTRGRRRTCWPRPAVRPVRRVSCPIVRKWLLRVAMMFCGFSSGPTQDPRASFPPFPKRHFRPTGNGPFTVTVTGWRSAASISRSSTIMTWKPGNSRNHGARVA